MRKPETFADHLHAREQSQNLQIPLGLQFGINIFNIPLIDPYIPGYNWQILYHYTYFWRGVQQPLSGVISHELWVSGILPLGGVYFVYTNPKTCVLLLSFCWNGVHWNAPTAWANEIAPFKPQKDKFEYSAKLYSPHSKSINEKHANRGLSHVPQIYLWSNIQPGDRIMTSLTMPTTDWTTKNDSTDFLSSFIVRHTVKTTPNCLFVYHQTVNIVSTLNKSDSWWEKVNGLGSLSTNVHTSLSFIKSDQIIHHIPAQCICSAFDIRWHSVFIRCVYPRPPDTILISLS